MRSEARVRVASPVTSICKHGMESVGPSLLEAALPARGAGAGALNLPTCRPSVAWGGLQLSRAPAVFGEGASRGGRHAPGGGGARARAVSAGMRAALRMPAHRRAARSLEAACSCEERLRLSLVRAITETRKQAKEAGSGCKEAKEAGARSPCTFWLSFKCNGYFGVPKPGRLECCQRCQPAHWHGTSAPRAGPGSRAVVPASGRVSLSLSLSARSQSVTSVTVSVLLSGRLCAVVGPNATQGLPMHEGHVFQGAAQGTSTSGSTSRRSSCIPPSRARCGDASFGSSQPHLECVATRHQRRSHRAGRYFLFL